MVRADMAAKGSLIGLNADDLQAIKSAAIQCMQNAALRGTSYSIAGRSFTFPTFESSLALLEEVNFALGLLTGARSMSVQVNFNPAIGRGS
jgi:hypothetical protein